MFGRGGEECEALSHAGVAYEVIPGISSAIAAPALAWIPVTHREHAHTFTVVTGHAAGDSDAKLDENRGRMIESCQRFIEFDRLESHMFSQYVLGARA